MEGKILLTGGSGFLGRAIMQTAMEEGWNASFTVYSRDEQKQDAVRKRFGCQTVLGDVRDTMRLKLVAKGHDVVIHTAALKYIPEAEFNVNECIEVNVLGSASVIAACRDVVDTVVAISTDKAVMPLNVYGASKMLMERLFIEADAYSDVTSFQVVRYGNVIGSTGSIIPVFEEQMNKQGHVTLTDPGMTRFWMSTDEAVELVCRAVDAPLEGGILVRKAKSMTLMDLKEALYPDAEFVIIGRRPGEKMHEALLSPYEMTKADEEGNYVNFYPRDTEPLERHIAGMTSDTAPDLTRAELSDAVARARAI
jgi:UDP-N-acetylglucosamine 4,6-dehydratase/5-epimerase